MRTTKVEVREKFFALLTKLSKDTVTKSEIKQICSEIGIYGVPWFTKDE